MTRAVREPIQTYLTAAEREELDRAASQLGVSRSEALRRGIRALLRGRSAGPLADLAEEGLVTPAVVRADEPPPSAPGVPFVELMAEFADDRSDR